MADRMATGGTAPARTHPTPARARLGLAVLASATFVYVTAETLPIGLLPQLSAGLHVRPGTVGLLVTAYAAVAGLAAIPLTATLEHRSRRTVVVACVGVLALSQFVVAVAPDYAVVLAARIMCALAHGVFWSMLAPVAARLAPPGQAGRATALVFVGNSLALVGGVPLGTALGHAIGWRFAMAALGVVAVVSTVALRRVLPPLSTPPDAPVAVPAEPGGPTARTTVRSQLAGVPAALRSGPLLAVCFVTVAAATGQFAAYTYITALPVVLQAAVLRVAPRSADTASALYVVAFQIGIGGGALAGSLLVNAGLLAVLPVAALALAVIGLLIVLAARRAFPPRGPAQPAPPSPADDLSPERPRQVRS